MEKARHLKASERAEENKKKRRAVRIILTIIIFIMVAAITAEIAVLKGMTSVDRRFIRGVERGVTEGWQSGKSDLQLREQGAVTETAFIDKELAAVEEFRMKPYNDKELRKLAKRYIEDLKKCKEATELYDPEEDNDAFWADFSGPYTDRLMLLRKFRTGNYKMGSSWDSYPELRDEVMLRGWAAEQAESLRFSKEELDDGVYVFSARLNNDSGLDIAYLNIDIELYDSSDKKLGTAEVYKENIGNGKGVTLKFYYSGKNAASYRAVYVDCEPAESETEDSRTEAAGDK